MRFESIDIARYGCLADLSTGDTPLPPIVVVLGPNESGKSTFFDFVSTMLYGFRPATRSGHPYTPWSGGDAEGEARIRLAGGDVLGVHRRLMSAGWARLHTGDHVEDIGNRPLSAANHVTRVVYRQVYALTLAELASLEGESWDLVQDRLVGAMAAPDLRPARVVTAEFEDEAKRLWRPDRRGRPRTRVLLAELAALNDLRSEALDRDRVLREKVAEKAFAEERLGALRDDRARERERRGAIEHRLNRLLPVRRTLLRIRELRAEAGAGYELDGLPGDPRGQLGTLRKRHEQAEARIEELEHEAAGCRDAIKRYGRAQRDMVEAESEIRSAANRLAGLDDLEEAVAGAESAVEGADASCRKRGKGLFSVPWGDIGLDDLVAVPASELREAVQEFQAVREQRRIAQEGQRDDRSTQLSEAMHPGRGRVAVGVTLLAAALVLAVVTLPAVRFTIPLDQTLSLWIGSFAAIAGFLLLITWSDANRRARLYEKAAKEAKKRNSLQIARLRDKEEDARSAVAEVVGTLPVQDALLEAPSLDLPAGLERMTELLTDRTARHRELELRREKLEAALDEVRSVGDVAPIPLQGNPGEKAEALIRSLQGALRARGLAAIAERDLARVESDLNRIGGERDDVGGRLGVLEERLRELGDGDIGHGTEEAARRTDARRRADQLRSELEREHPDLDELVAGIRDADAGGEQWESLDETLETALAERDELIQHVEELQSTIGRLESEIGHLHEGETPDQVDGHIAAVKERIREAKENRDRAFVLARLVREADRRFREEHQPDLLLRAGGYLRHITAGRYDRIELGEGDDRFFYLRGPAAPQPRKLGEPLSQGTKEQVYLALRLAIIDHLDADDERLPLCMDEALVNWDAWRRDRAFGLLERVAERRQVFLFTCHPAMAAEMEDRGGRIIVLGAERR